jgi:hypothetical protein
MGTVEASSTQFMKFSSLLVVDHFQNVTETALRYKTQLTKKAATIPRIATNERSA